MYKLITYFIFTTLTLFSQECRSAQSSESYVDTNSWFIGASIGYGKLQNPLVDRKDIPLYVLPDIRYFGERLSVDNLDLSFSLLEKKGFVIDILGTQNIDGVFFPGKHRRGYGSLIGAHPASPIDAFDLEVNYKTVPPIHRSMSYLAGIEMRYYGWLSTFASWQTDITNVHHGEEIVLKFLKDFSIDKLNVIVEGGVIHKSSDLVNYYYGVDINHTFNSHYFYKPGSSNNTFFGINTAYRLNDNFAFVASFKKQWLGSEIKNSPVVDNQSPISFFVGVKYVL